MVSVSARQLLLLRTDFLGGDPVPGAMNASAATPELNPDDTGTTDQ